MADNKDTNNNNEIKKDQDPKVTTAGSKRAAESDDKSDSEDELPYQDKDVMLVYAIRHDSSSDVGCFDCYNKEEMEELIKRQKKDEEEDEEEDDEEELDLPPCIQVETLSKEALRELEWEEKMAAKKKKQKSEDQEEDDDEEEDEEEDDEEELDIPIGMEEWGILELSKENPKKNNKFLRVECIEKDPFRGSIFPDQKYQWKWISKMKKVTEKQDESLRELMDSMF